MNETWWYLLAGTRGGETRARMLLALHKRPLNAHQLAKTLGVDYTTIQHHLAILAEHRMTMAITAKGYGQAHAVATEFKHAWNEFDEIWERLRTS